MSKKLGIYSLGFIVMISALPVYACTCYCISDKNQAISVGFHAENAADCSSQCAKDGARMHKKSNCK